LIPQKETPVGKHPGRRSGEKVMDKHHSLLPKIVVILRIRVKIIIGRR
jgi:hypothetical protein